MHYYRHVGVCCLLFLYTALYAQKNEIRDIRQSLSRTTDSIQYVDALNRLSALYLGYQLDSGEAYARSAYDIALRHQYVAGKATANRNLGRYYLLRPQIYLAIQHLNRALSEYRSAGDSSGVALTLMQLGTCYFFQKDQKSAQALSRDAIRSAYRPTDSLKSLLLASWYAINRTDTTSITIARKTLLDATRLANRSGCLVPIIYTRILTAKEIAITGKTDSAIVLLKKVLQDSEEAGQVYMALYTCELLNTYLVEKRNPDSLHYQQQMIRLGEAGGYTGLILPVINRQISSYLKNNNAQEAAKYGQLALQIVAQQQNDMKAGEADYLSYFFGNEMLTDLRREFQHHSTLLASTTYNSRFIYYRMILIVIVVILVVFLLSVMVRLYRLSDSQTLSLKKWQHEMATGNIALQENDDFKNKLLSMIAHDFRTPLHNIVSITGFVNEQVLTPAEAAGMIGQVDKTAAHTLQLFDEISRWIQTQLSGFAYKPTLLQLRELLSVTEQSLKMTLQEKSIRLLTDVSTTQMVLADYEMLQFIHRNFLHNAVKFSPDNGIIRIHTTIDDQYTTVYFTDEGSGIDEEILPWLFEWHHLSKEKERTGKGAGIALIICKDFIDKMNGTIGAFNNEDEGSTFFYRLPHN